MPPRARKFVSREDPFGRKLKNLVREDWGGHTVDGNRRDRERIRKIKEVVDSLPDHVWKGRGEWYVHPRARDARVEA
jgi:hypothetical protein